VRVRCLDVGIVLYIILLFFIGLIVGALGRFLLPGPDPMTVIQTVMVGLAGSFAAGLFSWYVLHRHGAGLLLSVLFTMAIVWLIRRYRRSSWSQPGPPGPRRF
jgi:uncharacterized membrane protein YeaQ/YmgE (transglycosylase-associated protein family)